MNPSPRKQNLIEAARQVFFEYGFEKTTVTDILKQAGISRATFYKRFQNKRDLYREVLRQEMAVVYGELKEMINGLDSPTERMNRYWLTRLKEIKKQPNLYALLKQETFSPIKEEIKREMLDRDIKWMEVVLLQGVEQGLFSHMQAELTAHAIIHALNGFEPYWLNGEEEVQQTYMDHLVVLLYDGIRRRQN